MLFSSLTFITLFLPLVVGVYFVSNNHTYRNIVLLIASLIFYSWGEPLFIVLMLLVVTINFYLTLLFNHLRSSGKPSYSKSVFILTIIINLLILGFFKYSNFLITNLNLLFGLALESINVTLPIGISFYTFQTMSYVIDAYRGDVQVQKKWYLLLLYVSLFPQLIAGPIVRYSTIEHELDNRQENWHLFNSGLQRFIIGLGKKIIIANNVALASNYVFNTLSLESYTFTLVWFGAIAYTLQIYFDFSAYSDMAIGIGHMFGFKFLENFNYPYIASSITDFWRRWHISLSTWFRDYLYIPLGGNRVTKSKWIFNIFIVWTLTGLWHGANWNFVFWGMYFGVILILEKFVFARFLEKLGPIRYFYTLILVIISWIIFNSSGTTQIFAFLKHMFNFSEGLSLVEIKNSRFLYLWPFFLVGIVGSTNLFKSIYDKFSAKLFFLNYIYLLFILFLSIMYLINNSYNPFIYFRF